MANRFLIQEYSLTNTGTKSSADEIKNVNVEGYKTLGIIGYNESNSIEVYYYNMFIQGNGNALVSWKTINNGSIVNHKVKIYVLYVKI